MAASPRDLLKPRSQRLMEVNKALQQQDGFADSVYIAYPATINAPGSTLTLPAGSWVFVGGAVGTATAAITIAAATGAAPFSGVTVNPTTGVLTAAGPFAASAIPANFASVNEFVGGANAVVAYDAGSNALISPSGTQGPTGSTGGF